MIKIVYIFMLTTIKVYACYAHPPKIKQGGGALGAPVLDPPLDLHDAENLYNPVHEI